MVRGSLKSRTYRRVHKVTPGGRNVLHFERRKPSKAVCGNCSSKLNGVPRELPFKMTNMPKTSKRPQRPFGGVLCSKCMRSEIRSSVREQ